jgi:hypothetical protein
MIKKQLPPNREIRLKIRESGSSPIDREPSKRGHVNPYLLLDQVEMDSDTEQPETNSIEEKPTEEQPTEEQPTEEQAAETKPTLHVDIDLRVQSPPLPSPSFAVSPPLPKKGVTSRTPTSARAYYRPKAPRKPPTTPTAKSVPKQEKSETKQERQILYVPPLIIPSVQQNLLAYLETLVAAETYVSPTEELKNGIKTNFKIDITKTSFVAAFNIKLQHLFIQRNSAKAENFFRSIIDSGLFQKLFPYITDPSEEVKSDIITICRIICRQEFNPGEGSLLKSFYERFVLIMNRGPDSTAFINQCLPLKDFYYIPRECSKRLTSVSDLNNWLQNSILVPRFICDNVTRLIEEGLLEKIFPEVGGAVTKHLPQLLILLKQIEAKSWSYETYWSTNPSKRFTVNVDHLVYAHLIVCAFSEKTLNVKGSLISILEENELFKQTFSQYQKPSPYYNLFKKAFTTMHGGEKLNPFTILTNSDKEMKFNYGPSTFFGTPKTGRATQNQDWRSTKHTKAFTP